MLENIPQPTVSVIKSLCDMLSPSHPLSVTPKHNTDTSAASQGQLELVCFRLKGWKSVEPAAAKGQGWPDKADFYTADHHLPNTHHCSQGKQSSSQGNFDDLD